MLLMYHHISPASLIPTEEVIFNENGWMYTISPEMFEKHIQYFLRKGFRFVSMDGYYDTLLKNGKENKKEIVITFDDGWFDNYEFAFPILKRYNIPAIFFITTIQFETTDKFKMNVDQIIEMKNAGMTFGSHTCNHKTLSKIKLAEARYEIFKSKEILEKLFHQSIDYFAYPGGAFNSSVAELVKEAGYKAACSILSPATNTVTDKFWLFRNHLTGNLNKFSDYYRLNQLLVNIFGFRIRKKLEVKLNYRNQEK